MPIDPKCSSIIMRLYETDLCQLQKFISGKAVGGKVYRRIFNFT